MKERVTKVLSYKKPAFWVIMAAIVVCVVMAVCFLTNPRNDTFDIKIVIPAGGEQTFYYSEEEISPTGKTITLSSGEGLGDTEVVLKPMHVIEENTYKPTYMTPGMPVKIDSKKGAWFKVGVAVSNPTEEDIIVYVRAKRVTVRIADPAAAEVEEKDNLHEPTGNENAPDITAETDETDDRGHESLEAAIYAAILEQNASSYPDSYDVVCCDFVTLEELSATPMVGDETHTIVLWGWELYQQYAIDKMGIQLVGGSHVPIELTFELDENGYQLKEYWQPRDGSYYVTDVRSRFPSHIVDDGLDSQKYITQQMQSCYRQAIEFSGLDTDAVAGNLLDTICSSPATSSNPQDYIDAHSWEYRELLYYGGYTLRYCFKRFGSGNETGLEGKVMAFVCEELLQTKGKIPADADTSETGQFWYDTLFAHASNIVEPYLDPDIRDAIFAH